MKITTKKKNRRKENRELIVNISMFLLSQEKLKNLFWNIKKVDYNKAESTIDIGIDTVYKLGTTLEKLRSLAGPLAKYLQEQGVTYSSKTKIKFFVDREADIVSKINNLIDQLQVNE